MWLTIKTTKILPRGIITCFPSFFSSRIRRKPLGKFSCFCTRVGAGGSLSETSRTCCSAFPNFIFRQHHLSTVSSSCFALFAPHPTRCCDRQVSSHSMMWRVRNTGFLFFRSFWAVRPLLLCYVLSCFTLLHDLHSSSRGSSSVWKPTRFTAKRSGPRSAE